MATLKGASTIAKSAKAAFGIGGLAAFGLGGALALHTAGRGLQDNTKRAQRQQNAFTKETFRESGWLKRQATLYTAGLATEGVMGGFTAMSTYNTQRVKDTFTSIGQPHVAAGAGIGAGLGLLTGIAAASFTKQPAAAAFVTGAGAIAGAYTARKVGLQIQEGVNIAHRNSLNKQRFSNRGRGGGGGFRSWSSNSRRMGRPGHLGMDGSVPFALHKVKGRSTV